jgi:hypothetical protein
VVGWQGLEPWTNALKGLPNTTATGPYLLIVFALQKSVAIPVDIILAI